MKMDWKRTGLRLAWAVAACAFLGFGAVGEAAPAKGKGPAEESVRHPAIRQIDGEVDAAAVRRIEMHRAKLPEKYRRRNNFAWAVAKIEGVGKVEYYAHSGIQTMGKLSKDAAEEIEHISLRPKKGRFEVLCVNHEDKVDGPDCWPRHVDTEYKILEEMARRIEDPAAAGRVLLYTDLYPCASCRHVMRQFLAAYPQVELKVLYRER